MHVAVHTLNVAIDAPCRLPDRERPRPVIVRNTSLRFAAITWNSNSGVAKLIRAFSCP